MICTIDLPGGAEALAGRPADDYVDVICSDHCRKLMWLELLEIALKHVHRARQTQMMTINEVSPQRRNGYRIMIYGGQAAKAAANHAKRESTTTTEQIQKGLRLLAINRSASSGLISMQARGLR